MYSENELIKAMLGAEEAPAMTQAEPEREWGLVGYPLASVYAPIQAWQALYDSEEALKHGTLFKELEKPFYGTRGAENGKL